MALAEENVFPSFSISRRYACFFMAPDHGLCRASKGRALRIFGGMAICLRHTLPVMPRACVSFSAGLKCTLACARGACAYRTLLVNKAWRTIIASGQETHGVVICLNCRRFFGSTYY